MRPGAVIAQRFVLEELAGRGAMGAVFRARDEATGQTVAIKILHAHAVAQMDRFAREARLLADLRHPSIVRHVAHGVQPDGLMYLAMEWLRGMTLAESIARGRMPAPEAIALGITMARALGAAHAAGIVHRDVKPSNVFLVGGRTADIRLLDFGIARFDDRALRTDTGSILGSAGYMAPEQARGSGTTDARSDVFALGCVIYHCIAGEPLYAGADPIVVIGKLLFSDPPRLSRVRPETHPDVDEAIAQLLAVDPDARPKDGSAAALLLAPLLDLAIADGDFTGPGSSTSGNTDAEQRLAAVVVCVPRGTRPREELEKERRASVAQLRAVASRHEAKLEILSGGIVVAHVMGRGAATDWAASAGRCAIALRDELPFDDIALATVRGLPGGQFEALDVALDRAVGELKRHASGDPAIFVDYATAALLGPTFHVDDSGRLEVSK